MKRHTSLVWLVIVILLGFALRLYQLDAVAFRGDEAFSAQYWAGQPLATTFSTIATIEPHPPLTYIVFRLWGLLVGVQTVFALRLLSVLSNTVGIAAMYALGKRLTGDRRVGLLSAAMWALHPFQIWHAQDFRNYALWAGLSVLTLWTALRVFQHPIRKNWILYAIVATVTGYVFYMELITIGILGLYVLIVPFVGARRASPQNIMPDSKNVTLAFTIRWSILNAAIIGLVFAAFFVTQGNLIGSGSYGGTTDGFELSQYAYRFLPVLNFGDTLSLEFRQILLPIFLIAFVTAWLVVLSHNRKQALFLTLLTIVPLIMIGIISTGMNIFRPRYVMMSSPAYILLLAAAIFITYDRAKSSFRQRMVWLLLTGFFVGWVAIAAISLRNYYNNPIYHKAPNWSAMTNYLRDNTQVGEVVIQTAVDSAYGFYYDAPADDFALPRSPEQSAEEIVANLEEWRDRYSSLWVVARTLQWANAGIVEAWVDENMQLVRDTATDGLPIREYKRWQVETSEIADEALTSFGTSIDLVGTRLFAPEPTGEITLWLYWHPQEITEEPFTVFVQLIGDINPITGSPLWSQDDHPPQNGRVTTDLWQTDIVYRDIYELPLEEVAAGSYEVWVGFYNPVTGERLLTSDGNDYYAVGTITVE
ncbi:MAG: glycosyltransferase family 39 protein [Anaerolineae bacterium]|nr:glycosyltransferase family 39 protein [Anaerolineae bacterium]